MVKRWGFDSSDGHTSIMSTEIASNAVFVLASDYDALAATLFAAQQAVITEGLARDALAADNEWLREGLRGIARMDPRTEGDRMVLWANDTLSGRATDLAATETKGEEVCVRCGAYKRGDIHICGHEANAFPD